MSEVKIKNQNKAVTHQVKPVKMGCAPAVTAYPQTIAPIYNNNGYLPTYQNPYYTSNYGYQVPQAYTQYPAAANIQIQPANPNGNQTITQTITNPQKQITPGATIDAAGTKCEIPPGTNGLNIIINSPTVATPGSHPMINTNTNYNGGSNGGNGSTCNCTSTGTQAAKPKKTKNIVALTDSYIKNLENFLRSPDKKLKQFGAEELAKRFEEEASRKTNPSLNALLNLVLQAKEPHIRHIALTTLKLGYAGGNDVTVQLLNNLQQSKEHMGLEASDAKEALLKMSETEVKVEDNSRFTPQTTKGDD